MEIHSETLKPANKRVITRRQALGIIFTGVAAGLVGYALSELVGKPDGTEGIPEKYGWNTTMGQSCLPLVGATPTRVVPEGKSFQPSVPDVMECEPVVLYERIPKQLSWKMSQRE